MKYNQFTLFVALTLVNRELSFKAANQNTVDSLKVELWGVDIFLNH